MFLYLFVVVYDNYLIIDWLVRNLYGQSCI